MTFLLYGAYPGDSYVQSRPVDNEPAWFQGHPVDMHRRCRQQQQDEEMAGACRRRSRKLLCSFVSCIVIDIYYGLRSARGLNSLHSAHLNTLTTHTSVSIQQTMQTAEVLRLFFPYFIMKRLFVSVLHTICLVINVISGVV